MVDSASLPPHEEYKRREQLREVQEAQYERIHINLGYARLLLVVAALAVIWLSLYQHLFSILWILLPVVAFIAIAIYHSAVLRKSSQAHLAIEVYRDGLARIEDRWEGRNERERRTDTAESLYAADLDLFGPGSLFELLCTARTRMGEDALAKWLLAPASPREIRERHAALSELRGRLDLREDLATTEGRLKIGVHPEELLLWAEDTSPPLQGWIRWIAPLFAVIAVATAIYWGYSGVRVPFLTVVLVEGILTYALRKRIDRIIGGTDRALQNLQLVSSLIARVEKESFHAAKLQALQTEFSSHHIPASQAIARLANLVQYINSLDNLFIKIVNIPLLYSVQVAFAVQLWRQRHGSAVRRWLFALGEMEALISIATYSYEHPSDPFPELVDGASSFTAQQLGHPLIPASKCVRNDITLDEQTRALLISGSNMSGKSTLMRSVGINTVLAMCGAPVRAQHLQLTPLHVAASILVNDSLHEGSSRFYAEIKRLRAICDLAEQHTPVLFLLDELLQGTNSADRLIGAKGIVQALIEGGAIGLISTHDLALTQISQPGDHRLRNMHFQDSIEDGEMRFDFKLQEGVVTKSNGVELMRLVGLKV